MTGVLIMKRKIGIQRHRGGRQALKKEAEIGGRLSQIKEFQGPLKTDKERLFPRVFGGLCLYLNSILLASRTMRE